MTDAEAAASRTEAVSAGHGPAAGRGTAMTDAEAAASQTRRSAGLRAVEGRRWTASREGRENGRAAVRRCGRD